MQEPYLPLYNKVRKHVLSLTDNTHACHAEVITFTLCPKAICLAWRWSSYTLPQAKATRVEPLLCMAWDPKDTEALANDMATILPKNLHFRDLRTFQTQGRANVRPNACQVSKGLSDISLALHCCTTQTLVQIQILSLCTRYTARSLNSLPSCTPNGMPAAGACCHRCTSLRQSVPWYTSMRHLQKREIQRTDMGQGIVRKSKHDLQRPNGAHPHRSASPAKSLHPSRR